MVNQYPYQLQILQVTGGGKDGEGNYTPPAEHWANYSLCRDEAGSGKQISRVDGTAYVFAFLIQMPKGTDAIPVGTEVKVLEGVTVRCKGKVVYSRKGQLHTQAWV